MKLIESPQEMRQQVEEWRHAGETVGFVPTMGALHAGHLSLVRRSHDENVRTVASIFVNPTQFRSGEDLQQYPRPFEQDSDLLQGEGCDAVFYPSVEAMYPGETLTSIEVEGVNARWEGELRPGHFRGVATVVAKLFHILPAQRAYFGEKDFQQLKVIEAMVRGLNFPIDVVPCPTLREQDGLAMSSRNVYLSPEERRAAPAIYCALQSAQQLAEEGERTCQHLVAAMQRQLAQEPLLQLEYSAIVDAQSLEPLATLFAKKPARAIIAAHAGTTRLIDNAAIEIG